MPFFEWSNNLSVKIQSIDNQHRKLVNIINELHDAMKTGKAASIINDVLGRLVNYTKEHFAFEERLFSQFGYPAATIHKHQHDALVKQVEDLVRKADAGALGLGITLFDFLKKWLTEHIMKDDMAYSGFLVEKGVK